MVQVESSNGNLSIEEATRIMSEFSRIRFSVERTPEEDEYLRSAARSLGGGGMLRHSLSGSIHQSI